MWRSRRQCLEPASASRCRTKARVAPHELSPDRRLRAGRPESHRRFRKLPRDQGLRSDPRHCLHPRQEASTRSGLCTGGPQTRRPYAPAYSGPSPNPTPVDTADDMHPAYSRPSPSAGGRDHRPHASRVYSRGVSS